MRTIRSRRLIAAFALLVLAGGVALAQSGSAEGAKSVMAKDATRKSSVSADLQKLLEQINSQRERMISDHDALAKQLKDATDEQRKAIMEKMQEQKKAFEAAQSNLHKQIRDEQRRQRQNSAPKR